MYKTHKTAVLNQGILVDILPALYISRLPLKLKKSNLYCKTYLIISVILQIFLYLMFLGFTKSLENLFQ